MVAKGQEMNGASAFTLQFGRLLLNAYLELDQHKTTVDENKSKLTQLDGLKMFTISHLLIGASRVSFEDSVYYSLSQHASSVPEPSQSREVGR